MPRYFLDVDYQAESIEDEDGSEYVDQAHARADAVDALQELVANSIRDPRKPAPVSITVRDSAGRQVETIRTVDILPPGFVENLSR